VNIGIPVVALCDANNDLKHVDLAIPANNKARRSLALVFWLLTREVLRSKKVITRDDEFNLELDEFEATL
jgi:small subunit ribosomal protein S2